MRSASGLVIGLLLISFPFVLLLHQLWEFRALERETWAGEKIEEGERVLDSLQRSSDPSIQTRALFKKLVGRFETDLKTCTLSNSMKRSIDFHGRFIRRRIPPHDFVMIQVEGRKARLVYRNGTRKYFPSTRNLRNLALWLTGYPVPNPEAFQKNLSRELGFPFPVSPVHKEIVSGDCRFFHSEGRLRVMYLDSITIPSSQGKLVFGALIDATFPNPGNPLPKGRTPVSFDSVLGAKLLAGSWNQPGCGLAFLPNCTGLKPVFSRFFKGEPSLVRHLGRGTGRAGLPSLLGASGDFLSCEARFTPEFPLRPILVYSVPLTTPGKGEAVLILALILAWVSCCRTFVEKRVFSRGPHYSIRAMLLAAFILIALVPLIASLNPGRRLVSDDQRAARSAEAKELEDDLSRLREGGRLHLSSLIQKIRKVSLAPDTVRRMREMEKDFQKARNSRSVGKKLQELLLSSAMGIKGAVLRAGTSRISVIGPKNYGFSGILEPSVGPGSGGLAAKFDLFKILGGGILKRLSPDLFPFDPVEEASERGLGSHVREQGKETFYRFLLSNAGPETFTRLLHYPLGLNFINIEAMGLYLLNIPILWEGVARYIVTWAWAGMTFEHSFLDDCLENGTLGIRNGTKGTFAVFSLLDKSSSALRHCTPPGIGKYPILHNLVMGVRDSKGPQRAFSAESQTLYEAQPPAQFGMHIFAGFRSIEALARTAQAQWWKFVGMMLGILSLAVLVAIGSARSFNRPLKNLLDQIERINRNDLQASLDETRTDEFGSIGAAFNTMVRKLREGRLLGRYVSPSVKKALEDERFREQAIKGRNMEITILFTQLLGFEEHEAKEDPGETFRLLHLHLDAVDRAARKFGGEIDKVMGEKILVLFHHESFEDGKSAVKAAIETAAFVRRELQEQCPLSAAMGLNSGKAVVGILGARGVKREFTAIGDPVNLAARLATLATITSGTRLVISGTSLALAGGETRTERLPFKKVKGKTQEVEAHLVLEG